MQQRRSNFFDQMPGMVSKLLDSLCSRFGVQFDESVLTLSRHGSVSSSASSSQSTRGIDYRVVIFGSSSQTGKPVSGLDLNNWYLISLFLAVFFLFFSFSITLGALTYFLFLGFPLSFRQLRCLGLKDSCCLSDKTWTGLSHINSHRVLGEDTVAVPSLYKICGWRKLFDSFVTEGLKIHEMAPTASGTRVSSSFSVLGLC